MVRDKEKAWRVGRGDAGWEPGGKWRRAPTLAEIPEEHIKKGDVDGLVGSSMVFNLAQNHLQSEHGAGREYRGEIRNTHEEKGAKRQQSLQPFSCQIRIGPCWEKLGSMCPDLLPLLPHEDSTDTHEEQEPSPRFRSIFSAVHPQPLLT